MLERTDSKDRAAAGMVRVGAVVAAFALCVASPVRAQDLGDLTIPASRIPKLDPGVQGGIPDTSGYPVINAVTEFGATPANGTTGSDAPAIQAAIDEAASRGTPTVVYLPAGTYYLRNASIVMRSNVVLRGDGPSQTRVLALNGALVPIGSSGYCPMAVLHMCGAGVGSRVAVTGGYTTGSTSLTVASGSSFSVGDWIKLRQNNDGSYIDHNDGTDYMVHVAQVTAKSGNQLTISPALRHDFSAAHSPSAFTMNMIEGAGVENLQLEFDAASNDNWQAVAIIHQSVNGWMKNVDVYRGWHYVMLIGDSAFNTLDGSHFRTVMWHERGNPPWNGYGIEINAANDNLVTNSVFTDLYIQVNLARGAQGNVVSYNYIRTDICHHGLFLHGHYPHANLFEGNDTNCWLTWDNFWGRQGPRNTMFRNRVIGGTGAWSSPNPTGARGIRSQATTQNTMISDVNLLANTMGISLQVPTGWDVDRAGSNMWIERNLNYVSAPLLSNPSTTSRNNVTGQTAPGSWSGVNIPASLYLDGPPDFWPIGKPWPAIGANVDNMSNPAGLTRLPAQDRFEGADTTPPGAPQIIFD